MTTSIVHVPIKHDNVMYQNVHASNVLCLYYLQLDKKLLKRYFEEHPHENLPEFADKVQFHLELEFATVFYGSTVFWLFCLPFCACVTILIRIFFFNIMIAC